MSRLAEEVGPIDHQRLERLAEEVRGRKVLAALSDAGVPARYAECSWGTWATPRGLAGICKQLRRWSGAGQESTALLVGPTGTGKTHLAVATMRRWVEAGRGGAMFVSAGDLLRRLRAAMDGGPGAGETELLRVARARLLALDDLLAGGGRVTPWAAETLSYLICQRYAEKLPTIITTNVGLAQIGDLVDTRVSSRLGEGLVVELETGDHRALA